jgi:hypothetical protein
MESRCRYTRINGARCTMPALNGHDLCFQHQQRKRQAQRKPVPSDPKAPGPLVNLVYMDDHTSVLANLNAIAEAFAYGLIDHHQLGALTRLMQTCLKTLHQKHELSFDEEGRGKVVQEVTYDEDGLALAVDPPPAPEPTQEAKRKRPRYADIGHGIGLRNTVEISAGAAPESASATPDPTICPAPGNDSRDRARTGRRRRTAQPGSRFFSNTYPRKQKITILLSNTCAIRPYPVVCFQTLTCLLRASIGAISPPCPHPS